MGLRAASSQKIRAFNIIIQVQPWKGTMHPPRSASLQTDQPNPLSILTQYQLSMTTGGSEIIWVKMGIYSKYQLNEARRTTEQSSQDIGG